MTIRLLIVACCLLLQAGCVSTAVMGGRAIYDHNEISNSLDNQEIAYTASNSINGDPSLKDHVDVSATTFNHLLLLTGTASTHSYRDKAVAIARQTKGVSRIYDGITVGPAQTGWQATQDSWITSKVKTSMIASSGITPGNFKVVTSDFVVYLMGAAPRDQVKKAVDIAKNTDGVKKVVNLMYYINLSTS
jgi:osmotically-inducible protein OsmY